MTDLSLRIKQLPPDLQIEIFKHTIVDMIIYHLDPEETPYGFRGSPETLAFWSTRIFRIIGENRVRIFLNTTTHFIHDFNTWYGETYNTIDEIINHLLALPRWFDFTIPLKYLDGLLRMYLSDVDVFRQIMTINRNTRNQLNIEEKLQTAFSKLINNRRVYR